jgi:outer membrane protein assembly factor BamB
MTKGDAMVWVARWRERLPRRQGMSLLVALLACSSAAVAQFPSFSRYELSEAVFVDQVDNVAGAHLTHLNNYIQAQEWGEALNTLSGLLGSASDKLIDVGGRRFMSVRDYCHQRLSALPPDVLQQYRSTADPEAEVWFQAGVAANDRKMLRRVVERAFASSWGDDALYRLAEIELERGEHALARTHLRMILPPEKRIDGGGPGQPDGTLLVYPDTDLPEAEVNARLLLISLLELRRDRAQRELIEFKQRYPNATGALAGREGKLAELLEALVAAGGGWTNRPEDADWPTFAGSNARTRIAPRPIDVGAKRWEAPLAQVTFNELVSFGPGPVVRRVATTHPLLRAQQWLLSYHPVVADGLALVNTSEEIYAYDLATGKPAWGQDSAAIFRDTIATPTVRHGFHVVSYGVPRYSLTVHNHKLYARMGSPLTSTLGETISQERRGYLVCLDLRAQGRLLWKIYPEQEKMAFEGSPVCDGQNLYVALRRSDVRPQAHVACYDVDSGQQRWMRRVCSAETIGRGQYEEATSNLLTLHAGALYVNTNLGAVARLSTEDGQIEWLHAYRQKQVGDLNQPQAYLRRDMTPCVYSDGRLFAAPSDSERIYALNADTGELLWDTRYTPDAIHMLGVAGDKLLVSGDRLYWIDCASGKLARYWPDGPSPKGYGRGALAGNRVYWPTRNMIFVFDQTSGELKSTIDLRVRDERASGGNLVIAGGRLLIAAADRLVAFDQYSRALDDSAGVNATPTSQTRRPR